MVFSLVMDSLPLDEARLLADFGLVVLIWLVQLIIYPSFLYTDSAAFKRWHSHYTALISIFVVPLMFGQTSLYVLLAVSMQRWAEYTNLALILAVWLTTFLLSVPCHDKMQKAGYDPSVIRRLISTNWIRTTAWSVVFGIDLWVLF